LVHCYQRLLRYVPLQKEIQTVETPRQVGQSLNLYKEIDTSSLQINNQNKFRQKKRQQAQLPPDEGNIQLTRAKLNNI